MDALALTLESWSKALQDLGSSLYLKAFADKGIAALSVVQFRYFELIARHPGISPGELARTMAVSKPTVAGVVAALERKTLVRKENAGDDGRGRRLYLEKSALEIAEYRRSMYALMSRKIRKALSAPECEALAGLMAKALERLPRKKEA